MKITVTAPYIADAVADAAAFIKYHKPGASVLNLTEGDFKLTTSQFVNRLTERRPEVITYRAGKGRTAALNWAVVAAGWPCDLIEISEGPEARIVIKPSWLTDFDEKDPAAFAPDFDPDGGHSFTEAGKYP